MDKNKLEDVLADILGVLGDNAVTADDTMLIADMLYEVASSYEKFAANPSSAVSMFFRSNKLDDFPLSKQRWGLDLSLITENN